MQNVQTAEEVGQTNRAGKYLTFRLAREEYGLEILKVQEIIGMMNVTRVPMMPEFMRGVINLRGKVIPVVDLRLKFGMESQEDTEKTCIIVVQVVAGEVSALMGIIVDAVSEVLNLTAGDIENTPDFGRGAEVPYLLGMANVKDKVKILLDIDRVLGEFQKIDGLRELFD